MKLREGELTGKVIDCITRVHRKLGSGFLEDIYKNAMMIEMKHADIPAESDKEITVYFEGEPVGTSTLDILVEEKVILGIKAVRRLEEHHYAELRSQLKAAGLEVGMLVNFAAQRADFRRVENIPREEKSGDYRDKQDHYDEEPEEQRVEEA